jgi:16S rRNA (cytosine967-C5)-methyltransferase
MNSRLVAARVLQSVLNGKSLADVLPPALAKFTDPRDRAFLQALCYGVCRYYTALDVLLSFLLKKPMQEKDADVYALILVGLYQLKWLRVPSHAAVSETVNATEELKKPWARGFVNAILREYLREADALEIKLTQDEEAHYQHPEWWITSLKKAWPDDWQKVLEANNQHPPFSLRVNTSKCHRTDYLDQLRAINISAVAIPETNAGITLSAPIGVDQLPGFFQGDISVQDGAAQLATSLLDLAPEQHVLDLCAAPGGKLMHILESQSDVTVVAVEKDQHRMASIHDNLKRAHLSATCICADANDIKQWWDGKLFDRILLDAPCSASGVVRRHPDIKLLRQPTDIKALAKAQLQLLETAWSVLKTGGKLVYATCSVFPEENTQVLAAFLAKHTDAKEEVITAKWGVPCSIGRQILPGQHNMDGFYYAVLRK